jgi:hypothetical protein
MNINQTFNDDPHVFFRFMILMFSTPALYSVFRVMSGNASLRSPSDSCLWQTNMCSTKSGLKGAIR